MATGKRKSKARIEQSALLPANPTPSPLLDRDEWIKNASDGFITSSKANREIYRVILETLWLKGMESLAPSLTEMQYVRR